MWNAKGFHSWSITKTLQIKKGREHFLCCSTHTERTCPTTLHSFLWILFLLQRITPLTHSTLSGYWTWVQNISVKCFLVILAWGVTGAQSKKVYRAGWASHLTPKVGPKRAKPPAVVDGRHGGEQGPNDCSTESSWIPASAWDRVQFLYFSSLKLQFTLRKQLPATRWL